jgi:predicted enzyme related to lactoylglutathione lyase
MKVTKLLMFKIAVNDMPKTKAFYVDELGLEVKSDYKQDDKNWWVSLATPKGDISITLSTYHENMKPGTLVLYFATEDIDSARKDLANCNPSEIQDDLFGPGSGVKWFKLSDPDDNLIFLAQT